MESVKREFCREEGVWELVERLESVVGWSW